MKTVPVRNLRIHELANLTKGEFLERVNHVRFIRVEPGPYYRNLIPTKKSEWEFVKLLYHMIHGGTFWDGGLQKNFEFEIESDLYDWMKTNSWETVREQIIKWIAAAYFFHYGSGNKFIKSIYKPLKKEAREAGLKLFPDKESRKPINLAKHYFESLPPKPDFDLLNDDQSDEIRWREFGTIPRLRIYNRAFFSSSDWKENVLVKIPKPKKGQQVDDLNRAESVPGVWEKWMEAYVNG